MSTRLLWINPVYYINLEYLHYGNTWIELEYIPFRIAWRIFNDTQKNSTQEDKRMLNLFITGYTVVGAKFANLWFN